MINITLNKFTLFLCVCPKLNRQKAEKSPPHTVEHERNVQLGLNPTTMVIQTH